MPPTDTRKLFTLTRIEMECHSVIASASGRFILAAEIAKAHILEFDEDFAFLSKSREIPLPQPMRRIFSTEECFIIEYNDVLYSRLSIPGFEAEEIAFPQPLQVYAMNGNLICYGDTMHYRGMTVKTQFPIMDAVRCLWGGQEFVIAATRWLEIFIVENNVLESYRQSAFEQPVKLLEGPVNGMFAAASNDGAVAIYDIRTVKCLSVFQIQPLSIKYMHFLEAQPELLVCGSNQLSIVRVGLSYAPVLQLEEPSGHFLHYYNIEIGFFTFLKIFSTHVEVHKFAYSAEAQTWLESFLYEGSAGLAAISDTQRAVLVLQYERDFSGCLRLIAERLNAALQEQQIKQANAYFEMYRPVMDFLSGGGHDAELEPEELFQDYYLTLYKNIPKSTPLQCCVRPTVSDQQKMELYRFILQLIEMRTENQPDMRIFVAVQDFIKAAPGVVNEQLALEFMTTTTRFRIAKHHPSCFIDFLISCHENKHSAYLKACLCPLCPSVFQTERIVDHTAIICILQLPILRQCRDDRFADVFEKILFPQTQQLGELEGGAQSIVARYMVKISPNDGTNTVIEKYLREVELPIVRHLQDNSFVDEACHQLGDRLRDYTLVDQASLIVCLFSLLLNGELQHAVSFLVKIHEAILANQVYLQGDQTFAFLETIELIISYVIWPAILRQIDTETPIFETEQLIGGFLSQRLIADNLQPKLALDACQNIFREGSADDELQQILTEIITIIENHQGDFDQYTLQQRREISLEIQALAFNLRQIKFGQQLIRRLEELESVLTAE